MQEVAITGVFGSAFFLTWLFYLLIFGHKISMNQRMTSVVGKPGTVPIREHELSFPLFQRFIKPMVKGVIRVMTKYVPASRESALEKKLQEAGMSHSLSAREVLVIKYLLSAALALIVRKLFSMIGKNPVQIWTIVVAGIFLGWLLPDVILNSRANQRKAQVEKQLPDTLDLLTVCIEAGLSFEGAMQKVVEKSKGILANELSVVLQETRMGKPRREALREMTDRLQVDDFSNFVGAIIMTEQLGISMGNVLRVQSKQVRQKRRQRVEEMAMKAPVKMLIPMVALIFPTVFVVLLGPALIQIWRAFGG
jgi:tight adherence protein C